jgi:hypothetical protein
MSNHGWPMTDPDRAVRAAERDAADRAALAALGWVEGEDGRWIEPGSDPAEDDWEPIAKPGLESLLMAWQAEMARRGRLFSGRPEHATQRQQIIRRSLRSRRVAPQRPRRARSGLRSGRPAARRAARSTSRASGGGSDGPPGEPPAHLLPRCWQGGAR